MPSIDLPHAAVSGYRKLFRYRCMLLAALALSIVLSTFADLIAGPSALSWSELWHALLNPTHEQRISSVIVWQLRLPYAMMAVVIGLGLGLAGAEMQTILNNPLASPFTLGISSAAAFGASLAIVLNISLPGLPQAWMVASNAFLFSLASALLLDAVARWGLMSSSGLVLFGIALVFSFNALVSLMQFIASAEDLQSLVFWTMGSLSRATWPKVGTLFLAVLVLLPLAIRDSWKLTALRLGEDRALSFGINVQRVRLRSLLRISLLASLAVSFVGPIGFIGLIAPHMARRLFGEDHRFYLPGSALMGALILSFASIVSKNMAPGIIVPVGIVTSLVGVPFFLMVVLRRQVR